MSKLYKLKNWYSIEDAARRLTETLGEEILTTDILQLAIENQLPLSWYIRGRKARKVAPASKIIRIGDMGAVPPHPSVKEALENGGVVTMLYLHPQDDEIIGLEGPFWLEVKMMGWVRDWTLSLITKTGGDLICLDGFIVQDREQNLWNLLDRFPTRDPHDRDSYFPSGELPEPTELGFQKADLETFEASLDTKPTSPSNIEKSLTAKERTTLLSIIIGMAVDGYGYDPQAAKSPTPKELQGVLAEHNIEMDVDTIRNKLKEASQFILRGTEN